MHILHLTPYMGLGGTERCILNLTSQALERGHQVSLASPEGEGLKKVPGSVKVYRIKNWRTLKFLSSIAALREVVSVGAGEADIIQVHASAEMAYLVKKYVPQKPVIFTCHGYDAFYPIYLNYRLASKFLKRVDCVIVLNEKEKEYFLQGGVKEKQLTIVPNGVEEKFFNASSLKRDNGKVVGLVGRLVKQKNIVWAIKTQARYRFARRLLIVGEGPLRPRLEKLVRKLKLEKEVIFLGYQERIEKIYPLFSYLLVFSRNEAFGLVILEALAAGVPVFIPQWLPGIRHFYESFPGIIIFRGGKDLKQKIERGEGRLKKDEIQAFARRFLWANIFNKYEELYSQFLARSRF